jgi:NAD(P)-dependent dehydrogenase (short-subunit alcohol dehydrogenase family)
MPLTLDVTNAVQIQGAVGSVESLDILVNNAGVDLHDDLSDRAGIDRHLAVNFFGTHGVTEAFLPLLARSQGPTFSSTSGGSQLENRDSAATVDGDAATGVAETAGVAVAEEGEMAGTAGGYGGLRALSRAPFGPWERVWEAWAKLKSLHHSMS